VEVIASEADRTHVQTNPLLIKDCHHQSFASSSSQSPTLSRGNVLKIFHIKSSQTVNLRQDGRRMGVGVGRPAPGQPSLNLKE